SPHNSSSGKPRKSKSCRSSDCGLTHLIAALQHVAQPPEGNDPHPAAGKLLTQAVNIEIDALGADVVVQAEYLVEKLLPGDGTGPAVHQHLQQSEFAPRERTGFIAQRKKAFIIVLQLSQPLALLGSSFAAAQQQIGRAHV